MSAHSIDVHAIADDPRQIPIVSWGVFAVATGQRLGGIRLERAGRFRLVTEMGEGSTHAGLREARDACAAAFSLPVGRMAC